MLQAKTEEQKTRIEEILGDTSIWMGDGIINGLRIDDWVSFDKIVELAEYVRSINQPKKEALDLSIVAPEMREVVEKWLAYKREKKQTYKPSGFSTFYKRLCKLSNNNPQVAMAIVEESMSNNYAGIFPLKNGNNNYGRPKTNTEKFHDTIQSANEFSQKLHERVGNQAEMGNGDSDTLW